MRRVFSFILFFLFTAGSAAAQMRAEAPPPADDGQCFARVLSPEIRETVTEELLVKPATFRIEVQPAVYDTIIERVLVKEQTIRHSVVPAVFETITEEVLVEPERIEKFVIPAQFETYTETIIIEPAREVWQPGAGLYGRGAAGTAQSTARDGDISTGDVLCRVLIPAKQQVITRSRMITPPQLGERIVPARYESVSRQVVVEPARVVEEVIPAIYEDRSVPVMVSPAEEIQIPVAAEYRTVSKEVIVGGGNLEWAEVLCETNTDRFKIAEIQAGLTDAGYPTQIDGSFGPRTQRAMVAFQRSQGLPAGYLTVETTRALDIDPYGPPPDAVYAVLGAPRPGQV